MAPSPQDRKSDRRDFLKNFLSDLKTHRRVTREELRKNRTRASLLALKHAKDDMELNQIRMQNPIHIEDSTFTVKVTGHDETGSIRYVELRVNIENRTVEAPETEEDAE